MSKCFEITTIASIDSQESKNNSFCSYTTTESVSDSVTKKFDIFDSELFPLVEDTNLGNDSPRRFHSKFLGGKGCLHSASLSDNSIDSNASFASFTSSKPRSTRKKCVTIIAPPNRSPMSVYQPQNVYNKESSQVTLRPRPLVIPSMEGSAEDTKPPLGIADDIFNISCDSLFPDMEKNSTLEEEDEEEEAADGMKNLSRVSSHTPATKNSVFTFPSPPQTARKSGPMKEDDEELTTRQQEKEEENVRDEECSCTSTPPILITPRSHSRSRNTLSVDNTVIMDLSSINTDRDADQTLTFTPRPSEAADSIPGGVSPPVTSGMSPAHRYLAARLARASAAAKEALNASECD